MNISEIQIRDPFILPYENKYYLYGSTDEDIWKSQGSGFNAYISENLSDWEGPFNAFKPPQDFWGTNNFWAPEVHYYNNSFYMFASFIGDGYNRGTAILKSENPLGPFIPWSEKAVTPADKMCLDGTLYIGASGQPWMVFCHEWVQTGDGTISAIKLSDDLKNASSGAYVLFSSSDAPWSKEVFSPSNNIRGYVTDGCFTYKSKNGELFMLWSCFTDKGYCQCYAVSKTDNIFGPWEQKGVLYDSDGGHGMLFRDFNDKLILTLHTPNKTPNERTIFMEVEEAHGELKIVGV